jgi:DNA-directed RNA polymerase specialized sigma24 family protein
LKALLMTPAWPAGSPLARVPASGPVMRLRGGCRRWAARARLHGQLPRVARSELGRRAGQHLITGPELDDLAHQSADDVLLAITAKLAQFRGESRFTTWAYKFVVLEVSRKLGRHFWRRLSAPLDAADWDRLPGRFGTSPADHAERRELVAAVRRAVEEELTERQRRVFIAIAVNGLLGSTFIGGWGSGLSEGESWGIRVCGAVPPEGFGGAARVMRWPPLPR